MQQLANRPWITAAVALVGAAVLAVTPVAGPLPTAHALDILLTAGGADITDITLDLVRHGQSTDNVDGILGTVPPGAHLTPDGLIQAQDVAPEIKAEFPHGIDAIYASELIRTQETAAPLAQLLSMGVHILPGLNEVNAGILEGQPLNTFTELGYLLPTVMWILGQYWVPMLGSDIDPNGMAFQDRVSDAIQTIYANSIADPHATDTDVAFSHAGTITAWVLMNVKNPDLSLVLQELIDTHSPLANTGQVVIDGNPTDGWTLVSWDGTEVPQTPDLGTALFVDFRDLIVAPQMAFWHIWQAIQGGDWDTITTAVQAGFDDIGAALARFPGAVFDDIVGALDGDTAAGAQAVGDAGAALGDLVASAA